MKICKNCKHTKAIDQFYKKPSGQLLARCKECHKQQVARSYNKNREYILERKSHYFQANKTKITKRMSSYKTKRQKYDINFKICNNLRSRLNHAIKKNYKCGSAVQDLGCSAEFLKTYLEAQFKPGMTWGNYGKWHIDHIKPLSLFNLTDPEQFKEACHYTNLQPLWPFDNIRKSNLT